LASGGKIVGDLRPESEIEAVFRCVLFHAERDFEFSNLEPYKVVRLKIDVDILPWMAWSWVLSERASHFTFDLIFEVLGDFSFQAKAGARDRERVEKFGAI